MFYSVVILRTQKQKQNFLYSRKVQYRGKHKIQSLSKFEIAFALLPFHLYNTKVTVYHWHGLNIIQFIVPKGSVLMSVKLHLQIPLAVINSSPVLQASC